ncbi:restriction of telomere capping protein 5 [Plectosphaerella plurivora]|uniref:Restriction of telomere capping protein 5 n=1 Tax=Plectosphaerella plurivora TaxID=936078 RepID=A0A9P9A5B1_9PEZI|nr:restriction of telomere capping protein 5 [Plectosphaerella plurivora]
MGQSLSDENPRRRSREELTHDLAGRFAEKSFTSLEIYSLKDVFKSLADQQGDIRYLKEDTIARFLEIPDILHVSPVVFQMVSYIGAFPFLSDAPAVLGLEQMVMVVTILTSRYKRVLAKGATDRTKLFFKSLAVHDRKASEAAIEAAEPVADTPQEPARSHAPGFAVDAAGDEPDEEDDDDLELAAFELLDINDIVKQGDRSTVQGAMIPADNFRKLLMLLILIAPLNAQEHLSSHAGRVVGDELESLRATAENMLATFINVEKAPGIRYGQFNRVIPVNFPHLFSGFNALFEHFLFSKNLDFSKHKTEATGDDAEADAKPKTPPTIQLPEMVQPLLQETGEIMDLNVLSQLSFFIPGSELFRRLRRLYSGSEDGFSMGSFETKVFNWRAPTILLVRGTRMQDDPHGGQEASFAASLPPRRFSNGSKGSRLTYGIYIREPWKHTSRECFGGPETVLFQLEPVHDVFTPSKFNSDYVAFTKPPTNRPLLSAGCPHPRPTQAHRRNTMHSLGSVSLLLDGSFEYGVFNHDHTAQGGAFHTSVSRRFDFQDRFEIESLEVWGCGGDEEARHQAERWAWEAREAEARRKINLGTGDIQADRALLEMAGLIGGNRSGGSMS